MEHSISDLEISISGESETTYSIELRLEVAGSETATRALKDKTESLQKASFEALKDLTPGSHDYSTALTGIFLTDPTVAVVFEKASAATKLPGSLLRIRLLLDSSIQELHTIHWECLRNIAGKPLATNERILFSRYVQGLDSNVIDTASALKGKALIAIANPANLSSIAPNGEALTPIDTAGELKLVRKALSSVDITNLEAPTLMSISAKLREGFDILYLVCHGAMIDLAPILLLNDEAGNVEAVPGERVADRIRDLSVPPRLVVLASCQSGQSCESLGPLLADAGVPAVVAMGGNFSMESNAIFMPVFFRELSKDGLIDRAMSAARGAIRDQPDAWMPILYMRLRTGRLWPVAVPKPMPAVSTAQPLAQPSSPGFFRRYWMWMAGAAFLWLFYVLFLSAPWPEEIHTLYYSKIEEKMAKGEQGLGILVDCPVTGHLYAFVAHGDQVEVLYPRSNRSSAVASGTQVRLPAAAELWGPPHNENDITVIWSPLPLNSLEKAIQAGASGPRGTQDITQPQQVSQLREAFRQLTYTTKKDAVVDPKPRTRLIGIGEAVGFSFNLASQ